MAAILEKMWTRRNQSQIPTRRVMIVQKFHSTHIKTTNRWGGALLNDQSLHYHRTKDRFGGGDQRMDGSNLLGIRVFLDAILHAILRRSQLVHCSNQATQDITHLNLWTCTICIRLHASRVYSCSCDGSCIIERQGMRYLRHTIRRFSRDDNAVDE